MTLTHVLTLVGCILAYFPSKLVRLKEEEAADASHFIDTWTKSLGNLLHAGKKSGCMDLLIFFELSLTSFMNDLFRLRCPHLKSFTLSDGEYYEMVKSNFERADRLKVVRTTTNYCTSIVSLLHCFKDLLFNWITRSISVHHFHDLNSAGRTVTWLCWSTLKFNWTYKKTYKHPCSDKSTPKILHVCFSAFITVVHWFVKNIPKPVIIQFFATISFMLTATENPWIAVKTEPSFLCMTIQIHIFLCMFVHFQFLPELQLSSAN